MCAILRDHARSCCIAFLRDLARNKWCERTRLCAILSVHALHVRSCRPGHTGTHTTLRTYMLSVSNMQHTACTLHTTPTHTTCIVSLWFATACVKKHFLFSHRCTVKKWSERLHSVPPQNFRIVLWYINSKCQVCDSRTELVADLLLIFHGKYSYINVN